MPIITSKFRPAWWLRGAHAQTLWSVFLRPKPTLSVERQRVELSDGDFIDLAWFGPKTGKTVLLLHGLEGGMESHYIGGVMKELSRRGYRACLMHFRGCSQEPNRLPQSYHSGLSSDPRLILKYLREDMGIDVYAAIGFSLGGNVLLKWLGEEGAQATLQRAAVMSVPFRLDEAARRMSLGFSRVYQRFLVADLKQSYKDKCALVSSPLHVDVDTLNTFLEFDEHITAPLHDYRGADDYYTRASSRQFIPHIRVPTLILHALDDPFMFSHTAPTEEELSEDVWLELPARGGHVGFISGSIPGVAEYWGEKRVAEWIDGG